MGVFDLDGVPSKQSQLDKLWSRSSWKGCDNAQYEKT
jgi:hypothetical protein